MLLSGKSKITPFGLSGSLKAAWILKETTCTEKRPFSYAAITDTWLGLALKVNKRVLTFCFGKFWKGNQSVATWLVSRQQFHWLLRGNNAFFCFCKCWLYWVNPSMFNSDNILWTSNEKTHLQKPEHNAMTPLNPCLEKKMHHIHDRLLALPFLAVDSRECQLLWTIFDPFNLFCE